MTMHTPNSARRQRFRSDARRRRRYRLSGPLLALLLAPSPSQAQGTADSLRFVLGAALGYSTFSFPEKLDHMVTFPTVNATLAATASRWQLTTNAGMSLQDADLSEEEDIGDASRTDLDVTVGYQLNSSVILFGGYKTGETEMVFVSRESEDAGMPVRRAESYSEEGYFAGISFSWRFERAGAVNLSLAYADLTATNEFVADEPDDGPGEIEFDDLTGRVDGDLAGFSYALTWTIPVASNLLVQTKFKINDYRQDIDFRGRSFDNVDVSFDSLHVGLAYVL